MCFVIIRIKYYGQFFLDGATACAARGAAQDHRGHEHWGAAQAHVLLPAWPGQAAPAQAVGLDMLPQRTQS